MISAATSQMGTLATSRTLARTTSTTRFAADVNAAGRSITGVVATVDGDGEATRTRLSVVNEGSSPWAMSRSARAPAFRWAVVAPISNW
jgi:hypothetical protein